MLSVLRIFRLGKVFSILLGVFTIVTYAFGSFRYLEQKANQVDIIFGLGALFFLTCAGYLMNDLCDMNFDLHNGRRPLLISKKISTKTAKASSMTLFVIGLMMAMGVNAWFFGLILIDMFALIFYNLYSKRLLIFKGLSIALIVVSIYPLSVAIASGGLPSPRRDSLLIFPIWLFLIVLAYELSEDNLDHFGDAVAGGRTLAISLGTEQSRLIATLLALASLPVAFLPFLLGMCGKVYLGGILLSVLVVMAGNFVTTARLSEALLFTIRIVTISSLIDIIVGTV